MTSFDRRSFLKHTAGGMAAFALVPDWRELAQAQDLPQGARLRVGLIGVGRRGKDILDELAKIPAVEVAALCDLDDKRRSGAVKRFPAGLADFANHRRMIESVKNLQAVIVATPTFQHRETVQDCLAAGLHVYCEAPLAGTLDDAKAIVKAAQAARGVCHAGFLARSNPVYKLARSFHRSGAIRKPVGARGQFHRKTSWRSQLEEADRNRAFNWRLYRASSNGLPGEEGCHFLDAVHWFSRIEAVAARGRGAVLLHKDDDREVADVVSLDFDLADGSTLRYEASLANSFEGDHAVLYGTHGTIKLAGSHAWLFKEADAPTLGFEVYAHTERFHKDEGIVLIADATKLAAQGKLEEGIGLPHDPLYYGLLDFVTSCVKGAEPVCSAADAFLPTALGILAQQAVIGGGAVAITPELLRVD